MSFTPIATDQFRDILLGMNEHRTNNNQSPLFGMSGNTPPPYNEDIEDVENTPPRVSIVSKTCKRKRSGQDAPAPLREPGATQGVKLCDNCGEKYIFNRLRDGTIIHYHNCKDDDEYNDYDGSKNKKAKTT